MGAAPGAGKQHKPERQPPSGPCLGGSAGPILPAMIVRALLLAALLAGPALGSGLAALVAGQTPQTAGLAGLAVVVADAEGVVRAEAYGDAVMGERRLAPDTPMRVASISKLVVAIGVWRLVEAGTLDPDRDVSDWLGWRLRNPAHPEVPVTLAMLLSHTSSVSDGPGYAFPLEASLESAITPAHWQAAAPGGRFEYANLNYGIIASVMEAATGERFDRLMRRLVLEPLSLDAGYNWQGASDAAVRAGAVLYRKGRDETAWNPAGPWVAQVDANLGVRPACPVRAAPACALEAYRPGSNGTLFGPQGGLRISALGLAKIGRLLLRGGEVDGVRLLRAETVERMKAPRWQAGGAVPGDSYDGQMLCYGAGPQCLSGVVGATDQPVPGARWFGHLGEAYGLLGGLWVDQAGGRVLVYLLTGTSEDPLKVPHLVSAFTAVEDAILADLAATPGR